MLPLYSLEQYLADLVQEAHSRQSLSTILRLVLDQLL
jgi:hypothetical protein